MLKQLKLEGVGPAPAMEIDLSPRLNVLTGDNGLGKSFLLDIAWWALTRTWAGSQARPREEADEAHISYVVRGAKGEEEAVTSSFSFQDRKWSLPEGLRATPGVVVYARVDGGFSVWDPARNRLPAWPFKSEEALDALRRIVRGTTPPAYNFDSRSVWDGLTIDDRRVCEGLIRDWVSWQNAHAPEFAMLERVLQTLSVPEEPLKVGPPTRVELGEGFDTPTLKTPYEVVPITLASAGARRVAALAYLLVWAWREHLLASKLLHRVPEQRIVLLVDEPETHLHPKWQRVILPAILQVATALREDAALDVQILTATHAPLVLASLEPLFDPEKDDLFVLEQKDGRVEVQGGMWAKQGDALNWLVSEAFGMRQARSREAERAIEAALAYMRGERSALPPGLRTQKAIHEELLRLLPGHDPFWPQWIVSVEHRPKKARKR